MSSPLAIVSFVLRVQPDAGPLHQLARNICSYLGPAPSLSLSQACTFGSLQLLDWVWDCSCTSEAQRTFTWTLTNYLRSDPGYYEYQFYYSMKGASKRGDLETVKWLFTHFSDCEVPLKAVAAAAGDGNLPMLQFLLDNDAGRRDREEGEGHIKKMEITEGEIQTEIVSERTQRGGGGHVVTWGPWVMKCAKNGKHSLVVQWLKDNVPEFKETDAEKETAKERKIVVALQDGDDALAKALMPPGRCVLDYAAQCSRLDLIELMLDCGYIRRSRDCSNMAIRGLAHTGRLDLMQQVVLLHSPPPEDSPLCINAWYDAVLTACENGYLTMLKWLMGHTLGHTLCDFLRLQQPNFNYSRRQHSFSKLVRMAGDGDHIDMMQYVYDTYVNAACYQDVQRYGFLLVRSVRDGRYKTAKWLLEHVRFPEQYPTRNIIVDAVSWGRLDILKFFHEMASAGVSGQRQSEQNKSDQVSAWWDRSAGEAINMAAESDHLEVLQWLLSKRPGKCTASAMDRAAGNGNLELVQWLQANRTEGSTTAAMDKAAMHGHLDVVKWLHANRSEGCTTAAMDEAASQGHLDIMKWLHANRSEGCTRKAMDMAAGNGHLAVVKWLCANRSGGCTSTAMEKALDHGNVAVANWLHTHLPDACPAKVTISNASKCICDVFLFVHEHFPHLWPQ